MTKVNFVGILINCDDSLLKISLDNKFKFKAIDFEEAANLFKAHEYNYKLGSDYLAYNHNTEKVYCVEKQVEFQGDEAEYHKIIYSIDHEVHNYLEKTFELMRLFNGGNIQLLKYYSYSQDKFITNFITEYNRSRQNFPLFHIEDDELNMLDEFLKKTKLPPFSLDYLQLALDNFNWSFETINDRLSFIAIMTGLEALFNPMDKEELQFRISRNCAITLDGKDKNKTNEIFEKVKELYKLRSKLIHGSKVEMKNEQIIESRKLLGNSIKKLLEINKPKNELLSDLDRNGFGG